jgi:hypothetical protein
MDAATIERGHAEAPMPAARARIGMIIPSVNSMTGAAIQPLCPPGSR